MAIGFVRHGARAPALIPVAWADLLADFGGDGPASAPRVVLDPEVPTVSAVVREPPRGVARRLGRRVADRLPLQVRRPLVLAAVMQVQAAVSLVRFGAAVAAYPVRRAAAASVRVARKVADRPVVPTALTNAAPGVVRAVGAGGGYAAGAGGAVEPRAV